MMHRILFVLIFVSLGALANGWWTNREHIIAHQAAKVDAFIAAGPRFTAKDGQKLCEALREIAKYSTGFQQSGKPLPTCDYGERP